MSKELEAKVNLSRYRILLKTGAGEMGEVYLGEDQQLGRRVAARLERTIQRAGCGI